MSKLNLITTGLLIVIALGIGYYFGHSPQLPVVTPNASSENQNNWSNIQVGTNKLSQGKIDFSAAFLSIGHNLTSIVANSPLYNKYTTGNWVDVYLTLNNNAENQISFLPNAFELVDQAGRIFYPSAWYDCDASGEHYVASGNSIILKPSIPCINIITFETSSTSKNFHINFQYKLLAK